MVSENYPEHTILPEAWRYKISGLRLELEPVECDEPFLELTFRKDEKIKILRFWSPQELEIERGGPVWTSGFVILDISSRGWDKLGIQVSDFEMSGGAIRFFARAVEER